MTLEALLAWWNVIYLLSFGLALLYLFAYAASGWTFGDVDAEADFDADADVDVDADVEAGVEVDAEVDADMEADVEHDLGHPADHALTRHHPIHTPAHDIDADTDVSGTRGAMNALAWLGVGRVPLSILLMVLLMTFGAIGFITNQAVQDRLAGPLVALISLPVALIGSLALTAAVGRSIARWLPMSESSARRRRELVGLRATTIFATDATQGVAVVRDAGGDRYQVACRTLPGRKPIAGGMEVVLVKYAEELGVFYVVPSELAAERPRAGGEIRQDDTA